MVPGNGPVSYDQALSSSQNTFLFQQRFVRLISSVADGGLEPKEEKHIWQDGQVVDENGRKVDLEKVKAKSKKVKVKRRK